MFTALARRFLVCSLSLGFLLVVCPETPGGTLDDFEALVPGPVNGQGDWHADLTKANVTRDFSRGGDQALRQAGDNNDVYAPLGGLAIEEGETATLFFRFMATSASANHGFGVTEQDVPDAWSDYRATALIFNDGRNVKMQGRNGNSGYIDLTLNGGANGLATNTWYDAWIVISNATDTADFYIQGGDITTQRLVGQGLPFRNGATALSLDTFFSRVGTSNYDPVLIDDVHVTPGTVTTVPAPAKPAATLDTGSLWTYAAGRLAAVDGALAADAYPSVTGSDGAWDTTGASSWTSGFFPGALWQMYAKTGDAAWRTSAEARTAGIEGQKTNDGTHDIGFMIFNSFGQGYKLTGNPDYKDVVLTAADTLATRYSDTVGAIQSWGNKTTGDYEVIIDNMMNLEILFWAADNGGPSSLYDIAIQHALTTREEHVRPDGGTYHVVLFDRSTGDVLDKYTSQGYSDDSTWSRGQAWGLYGFTMTYRETLDSRFLDTAQAMADYTLDHLTADMIPYYDYDDPANPPAWDTSAAAITASALLELCTFVDEATADEYLAAAEEILTALAGPGFLSDGAGFDSILLQGCVGKNRASDIGTSYGDYYFLEALARYDAIPEPATIALLGLGALALFRRRRA